MRLLRKDAKEWPNIVLMELREIYQQTDNDLVLSIKEDKESRSNKQNRLLWLWHGELASHLLEHQGKQFGTDDIHEYIVGKVLPRKAVIMPDGEPVIVRASTKKLKVKEFADLLNKYEYLCSETYGLHLTRPDDLYFAALMRDEHA